MVDDDEGLDGREVEEKGLLGFDRCVRRGEVVIFIFDFEAVGWRDQTVECVVPVFFPYLVHYYFISLDLFRIWVRGRYCNCRKPIGRILHMDAERISVGWVLNAGLFVTFFDASG